MSYSIPKTSLVITMGGGLLVASLFFYFLYVPNRRILDQAATQVKELEQKIRIESVSAKNLQREIASLTIQNTCLNYFNKLNIQESERIPYLLKSLTQEANTLSIKFLSVDPQHPEKNGLYQKYIFKVEVRATYRQMLRFLSCIENKLKLNIDRFSLSRADQFNSARSNQLSSADLSDLVTARIHINTLEMEDSQLKDFHCLAQVKNFYLDPNLGVGGAQAPPYIMDSRLRGNDKIEAPDLRGNDKIEAPEFEESERETLIAQAAQRDPFHPEEGLFPSPAAGPASAGLSLVQGSKNSLDTPKQPSAGMPLLVKKDDKELVLNAIIDFHDVRDNCALPEDRVAILGQDLVKSGDIVKNAQVGNRNVNMKVLNIGENTVTLGDGQGKYILKLPDNPVQFK